MTSASVFPDSDELESDLTNLESANLELTDPELTNLESVHDDVPVADAPFSVTIPDRADAPVSEITERFFKAIVAKVPIDRIEELHLFAPLRQGGVETGIAVIAARVIVPVAVPAEGAVMPLELPLGETDAAPVTDAEGDPGTQQAMDQDAAVDDNDAVAQVSDTVDAPADDAPADDAPANDASAADVAPDESPYAPETLHELVVDAALQSMTAVAQAEAVVERHTVYTARYRLVQKGPERGKWEASVVDEADAPLVTVDLVVRGVQRRAGEASETTRYTGAQIARALRLPQAP